MSLRTALRLFRLSVVVVGLAFTSGLFAHGQTPQSPPTAVGIGPGQSPAPTPQEAPTFRVTAREVLLDVLVIDKSGQPVTGLKPSDFSVTEEGESQVIRRVDEHHAMDAADLSKLTALPQLPPNTFSNYTPVRNSNASIVLLLDAMDSPIEAQMVMREQLIKFLKNMQPGPPVAIFQLDTEMRLIQGFTTDPKALLAAAESKRDMPSLAKPTAAPRSYGGDALYRRVLMGNLRDGMRMMGSYLAGYPGRKNLIWFTGRIPMTRLGQGFGNPFGDGMTVSDSEGESKELTDVLSVSRIAVYPVDTFGLVAEPGFSAASARGGMPAMRARNSRLQQPRKYGRDCRANRRESLLQHQRFHARDRRRGSHQFKLLHGGVRNHKYKVERRIQEDQNHRGPSRCAVAAQGGLLRVQPRQARAERNCGHRETRGRCGGTAARR
jgi:VWFA-related protein